MKEHAKINAHQLLTRLGKLIGTDVVYLAKGGWWLTIRQVFAMGSAFIASLVFGRYISQNVYGDYKYLLSTFAVLSTLSLTGLGSAVMQSAARGFDGTLIKAFRLSLKWSGIIFIGSIGFALYQYTLGNRPLAIAFLLVSIAGPLINSFQLAESYFAGKRQFKTKTLYGTASDLLTFVCTTGIALIVPNFLIIAGGFFLSTLISKWLTYSAAVRTIADEDHIEYDVLHFGKHLSFANIIPSLVSQVDKLIVYHILGPAQLAIYVFALAIPKQVRTAVSFVSTLAAPKYASKTLTEAHRSVRHKLRISLLFMIPTLIAYEFAAPTIYRVLYPNYLESIAPSQIYALLFLLYGNLASIAIEAKKQIRATYILNAVSSVIQLAFMLILIIPYGISGVVIGILIGKISAAIMSYFFLKRAAVEEQETADL